MPSSAGTGRGAALARWTLLAIFFASSTLLSLTTYPIFPKISPFIDGVSFCAYAIIHSTGRYGGKSTAVLLLITWGVSVGLEISSVHNGFPFGMYSYVNAPPPLLFGVPFATGAVYFGMAYVSWMLAQLLLGQSRRRLEGRWIVAVPVVATFLMVMWDFCLDPVFSTIFSVWVWPTGGSYFGVPVSNFAGWMFSAFIIFLLFGLYLARRDVDAVPKRPTYWYELILAYFLQGVMFVWFALSRSDHVEIYESMALVFVYTMLFVTILGVLTVWREKEA